MHAKNESLGFTKDDETVSSLLFNGNSSHKNTVNIDDKYEIPDDSTLVKCQIMAVKLQVKYPQMKPDRIARKVAEYYHLSKIQSA